MHRNKGNRGCRKLIAHARMRVEQRCGVSYVDLRQHLRRDTTLNAARLSHTRVLKVAKVNDEVVWFVYSLKMKQVVTVLSPASRVVCDAIDTNKRLPRWAVESTQAKGASDGNGNRDAV